MLQAAKRAEQVPGVEQIVVYQCCTDYLTHMDYETYLTQYFIALKRNIKVYTFQRGSASLNYSRKKEVAEQVKTDAERIAIGRKEEAGRPEIQQIRRIADFAAVCRRLQNTGTMICIFSPGSCTGALDVAGLKNYERIYMSRLTDSELITGCSRAFAEEAARLAKEIGTERIALIGTPITRLLYTDFKETAEILKTQGFLVDLFDTNGYETTE